MSKTSPKGVLSRPTLQNEHCEGFVCFAGGVELYPGSQIMEKFNLLSQKMHRVQQSLNHEQPGKWRDRRKEGGRHSLCRLPERP